MAIASLVLGIVALIAGLVPCVGLYVALPLGLIGLILGFVARKAAAKEEGGTTGMATAGLVISLVALIISFAWFNMQKAAVEEVGAAIEEKGEELKEDLNDAKKELKEDLDALKDKLETDIPKAQDEVKKDLEKAGKEGGE
jgi:hypothetical protein